MPTQIDHYNNKVKRNTCLQNGDHKNALLVDSKGLSCSKTAKRPRNFGLAEHLASIAGEAAPGWCSNRSRFLTEPFFATGLESLKAILLVESPTAFRRRMLFVGHDVVSRV
jgi:hypothetical protein